MSSKDRILGRIRRALRDDAPAVEIPRGYLHVHGARTRPSGWTCSPPTSPSTGPWSTARTRRGCPP